MPEPFRLVNTDRSNQETPPNEREECSNRKLKRHTDSTHRIKKGEGELTRTRKENNKLGAGTCTHSRKKKNHNGYAPRLVDRTKLSKIEKKRPKEKPDRPVLVSGGQKKTAGRGGSTFREEKVETRGGPRLRSCFNLHLVASLSLKGEKLSVTSEDVNGPQNPDNRNLIRGGEGAC